MSLLKSKKNVWRIKIRSSSTIHIYHSFNTPELSTKNGTVKTIWNSWNYHDPKVKLCRLYFMVWQRKKKVYRCKYEETDSLHSVQSSLKSFYVGSPVSNKRMLQEYFLISTFLLYLFHYFLAFLFKKYPVYAKIFLFI